MGPGGAVKVGLEGEYREGGPGNAELGLGVLVAQGERAGIERGKQRLSANAACAPPSSCNGSDWASAKESHAL